MNFCWQHAFMVSLCRIDLGKPDEPNQVELGRKDEAKVYKMFLDHTGEAVDHGYLQTVDRAEQVLVKELSCCFVHKENRSVFHGPDSVSQDPCLLVGSFAISNTWACCAYVVFSNSEMNTRN